MECGSGKQMMPLLTKHFQLNPHIANMQDFDNFDMQITHTAAIMVTEKHRQTDKLTTLTLVHAQLRVKYGEQSLLHNIIDRCTYIPYPTKEEGPWVVHLTLGSNRGWVII